MALNRIVGTRGQQLRRVAAGTVRVGSAFAATREKTTTTTTTAAPSSSSSSSISSSSESTLGSGGHGRTLQQKFYENRILDRYTAQEPKK
ncbi:hypothetical protein GGI11_009107, partial [Coemansia sp. RSA 2049]